MACILHLWRPFEWHKGQWPCDLDCDLCAKSSFKSICCRRGHGVSQTNLVFATSEDTCIAKVKVFVTNWWTDGWMEGWSNEFSCHLWLLQGQIRWTCSYMIHMTVTYWKKVYNKNCQAATITKWHPRLKFFISRTNFKVKVKLWYHVKVFVTKYTHLQNESHISSGLKVMANVNIFQK